MIYENVENFDDSVENDSKKEILVMENQLDMEAKTKDEEASANVEIINDNLIDLNNNMRSRSQGCQCGTNAVKICKKNFCEQCPNAPLVLDNTLACLECLIEEKEIYTSKPEKSTEKINMEMKMRNFWS